MFQHIQAEDFGGDESNPWNIHSTYKQPVNNDGQSGEGIYKTCEDSFACNLIYFSPIPVFHCLINRHQGKDLFLEVQFYNK